jgi:hypothetical protein
MKMIFERGERPRFLDSPGFLSRGDGAGEGLDQAAFALNFEVSTAKFAVCR